MMYASNTDICSSVPSQFLKKTMGIEESDPQADSKTELKKLFRKLCTKLDSLCNFHYTPKAAIPEMKVIGGNRCILRTLCEFCCLHVYMPAIVPYKGPRAYSPVLTCWNGIFSVGRTFALCLTFCSGLILHLPLLVNEH